MSASNNVNQLQTYGQLALKAQAQSRVTLATLVDLKNPNSTTFIKQQNNAINQQVNNLQESKTLEKSENLTNELLLNEVKHEALDIRGKAKTIPANSSMETVDTVNRSKNTRRKGKK